MCAPQSGCCLLRVPAVLVLLLPALAVVCQASQDVGRDESAAGFEWQSIGTERDSGRDAAEGAGWTLDPDWTLDPGPDGDAENESTAEQQRADAWMLGAWAPSVDDSTGIDAGFTFRRSAVASSAIRADRWARSVFATEASMLTPLTAGQEVFGWQLADGFTLSGVGSRRVITDRDRGIVFSAEAGIRLAPNAGFQLGYELLQASSGPGGADLGAESLFARFQLRF